ncbi:unnamed protein product [Litomosoides sigmodontis]|uniref:Uncharacterized protein n=1 Tax=Litomosoides sigmodontis TaxID=42156 RepID=A0A3P6T8G8_LITSI|nr:unnamed protein product [Litomosoides sigmodontis]
MLTNIRTLPIVMSIDKECRERRKSCIVVVIIEHGYVLDLREELDIEMEESEQISEFEEVVLKNEDENSLNNVKFVK